MATKHREDFDFDISRTPYPKTIAWGNGEEMYMEETAKLGKTELYTVEEGLVPNSLISCGGLTDMNFTISFDKYGATITHPNNEEMVRVKRDHDGSWHFPLWALPSLSDKGINGRLMTDLNRPLYSSSNITLLSDKNNIDGSTILSARLHTLPNSRKVKVLQLHERLCHPSQAIMELALETSMWIKSEVTVKDIRRVFSKHTCLQCALSKRNSDDLNRWSSSNTQRTEKKATEFTDTLTNETRDWKVGEVICVDDFGPVNPATYSKRNRGFLFKDVASHKLFTSIESSCNSQTFINALEQVVKYFQQYGHTVKVIRSDYSSIYLSEESTTWLTEHGIRMESSTPYQHWQNGVERDMQTMIKAVSTMLYTSTFTRKDLWGHALEHYVYVHGYIPNKRTRKSPNYMISGEVLDVSYQLMHVFGEVILWRNPKELKRWKFDIRNEVGLYLGDRHGLKGAVQAYHPYRRTIETRGNVWRINVSDLQLIKWYESQHKKHSMDDPYYVIDDYVINYLEYHDEPIHWEDEEEVAPEVPQQKNPEEFKLQVPLLELERAGKGEFRQREGEEVVPFTMHLRSHNPTDQEDDEDFAEARMAHGNPPLKKSALAEPEGDSEGNISAMAKAIFHTDIISGEDPEAEDVTLHEACTNSIDKEQWIKEIRREVLGSIIGSTQSLVPVTKEWLEANDHHMIGTTVKCKRKKKGSGVPDKIKARMAMRGDQLIRKYKREDLETPQSYSPTVATLTHNTIFQLAVKLKKVRATGDITAAYLQVSYPVDRTPIVCKLEKLVATVCDLKPDQVYHVMKSIYGLPDSGRAFYYAYKHHLLAVGYKQSRADPCLFIKDYKDEGTVWLEIHVDDTYLYGDTKEAIEEASRDINKRFPFTLDWSADSFLGVQILTMPNGDTKFLQPKLLRKILKNYPRRSTAKRKVTHPYGPISEDKGAIPGTAEAEPCSYIDYMSLLGQLMYLTRSRPELQTALSLAACKAQGCTVHDFNVLYHCVDYLHDNPDLGYMIKIGEWNGHQIWLICQVDASYLLHLDSKGHTGYLLSFNGCGTFHCKSIKQSLISTSSTHAEMRALYTLVKDIIFVILICEDLDVNLQLPAIIMEDNSATLQIAKGEAAYLKKCKLFLMLINYVREQVEQGLIAMVKIHTDKNTADLLTKRLRGKDFTEKSSKLRGEISLLEDDDEECQLIMNSSNLTQVKRS